MAELIAIGLIGFIALIALGLVCMTVIFVVGLVVTWDSDKREQVRLEKGRNPKPSRARPKPPGPPPRDL